MGGMFGVAAKFDCVRDLFYGTDYHSHLGTRRGGMAVLRGRNFTRIIHNIENTQFRSKFEEHVGGMKGRLGIGCISDTEDQPLLIGSHLGPYAIVSVGRINNIRPLLRKVFDRGAHLSEMSGGMPNATELMSILINQGATFEEGIRMAHESIDGSCSLLILTSRGIYAARDRLGRTPLLVGEKEGAFCAAMETCAFPNLGYALKHELGPGEIVRVSAEGMERLAAPGSKLRICAFLWVYYGFPASTYEGINVEMMRNRSGAILAKTDRVDVDMVAGVPDSGIPYAIGYANEAGIPYLRPFTKYTPTWPRSFMPHNQKIRNLVARMKLIPIPELIRDKRLLFTEDSIVRGTQLRETIRRLYTAGAREVHMRPACPPLIYTCRYLNFSQSRSELDLAGRRAIDTLKMNRKPLESFIDPRSDDHAAMVDIIREQLNLTSLRYQTVDNMLEAIGMEAGRVCTYCWDRRG